MGDGGLADLLHGDVDLLRGDVDLLHGYPAERRGASTARYQLAPETGYRGGLELDHRGGLELGYHVGVDLDGLDDSEADYDETSYQMDL